MKDGVIMAMSSFTVKSLLKKIDDIYNGKDEDEEDKRTHEAWQILNGVVDILKSNPDNFIS